MCKGVCGSYFDRKVAIVWQQIQGCGACDLFWLPTLATTCLMGTVMINHATLARASVEAKHCDHGFEWGVYAITIIRLSAAEIIMKLDHSQ
jgi:hypothetical protein